MNTEFVLRFEYGSAVPWITRLDEHSLHAIAGPDMVVLEADVAFEAQGFRHRATFAVAAGDTATFSLRYGASYLQFPPAIDPLDALKATEREWENWSKQCKQRGQFSEAVLRSAITLKALTYRPTGGIVAAPTTSLPESRRVQCVPGSKREVLSGNSEHSAVVHPKPRCVARRAVVVMRRGQ